MESISITKEIVRFHALAWALIQRHVASRYRGSALGFLWSLTNPLCLMLVYTFVFHHIVRVPSGTHYHIMLLSGLLPWLWTASSLAEGTSSIAGSGHLITKSMFPAHLLPLVSLASTLANFLLSLPLLLAFMLLDSVTIPATVLLLPVLIFLHGIGLFGMLLTLSSLNVMYRDVQHIVGNLLTLLFFLTPIVYPSNVVPDRLAWVVMLNPLAQLTEAYRALLVSGTVPSAATWTMLSVSALLSFVIGSLVYAGYRERFAEVL